MPTAKPKLEVGDKAPSFALKNQDDKVVKLTDLAGSWVVLYFYPKDDTPGCTTEACEMTDSIKAFEKVDAVVYGCSPDAPERHRKFIAKYGLKIGLLSDPDHKALIEYGAWGKKNMYGRVIDGVIRSTFVIDPHGRIVAMWPKVSAKGHAADVLAELTALRKKSKARPEA